MRGRSAGETSLVRRLGDRLLTAGTLRCRLVQSDTRPIAAPARTLPRAFVQSGFNEVRSCASPKIMPRTSQKPLDSRIAAGPIQVGAEDRAMASAVRLREVHLPAENSR
jgi:hypothetical protein